MGESGLERWRLHVTGLKGRGWKDSRTDSFRSLSQQVCECVHHAHGTVTKMDLRLNVLTMLTVE